MKPVAYLLLMGLTASLVAAEVPDRYQAILRRNVFNPSRSPESPRGGNPTPVATPPPRDTVTLVGVAILGERPTALFAGSSPGLAGTRTVGESLDLGRLTAVDTHGVTLLPAGAETPVRLEVGQSLARLPGQAWESSSERVAAAPPGSTGTSPAAGPATGGSPEDILKRMMERRQRELKP